MPKTRRVEGRIAIVTGAAQGIGLATARCLAGEGAKVVFADVNVRAAKARAQECAEQGYDSAAIAVDVRRLGSIRKLVERCIALFGRIDILVNNAALQPIQNVFDVTEHDWNELMAVNLRGPFFLSQIV